MSNDKPDFGDYDEFSEMENEMEEDLGPSRSARKREAKAQQKLGERLIALKPGEFAQIPLPEALFDAISAARNMKAHGALRRQRLLIGKLMRQHDTAEIETALARLDQAHHQGTAQFHAVEKWRDRLIEEGDEALTELLEQYPEADRQRIRQLMRQAVAEKKADKPPKSGRELFKLLRDILGDGL